MFFKCSHSDCVTSLACLQKDGSCTLIQKKMCWRHPISYSTAHSWKQQATLTQGREVGNELTPAILRVQETSYTKQERGTMLKKKK